MPFGPLAIRNILTQYNPPQLFRLWINISALEYVAWQMGGNWGKANQVNSTITTQKCSSRLGLA
jgi:hypothetical protein